MTLDLEALARETMFNAGSIKGNDTQAYEAILAALKRVREETLMEAHAALVTGYGQHIHTIEYARLYKTCDVCLNMLANTVKSG